MDGWLVITVAVLLHSDLLSLQIFFSENSSLIAPRKRRIAAPRDR